MKRFLALSFAVLCLAIFGDPVAHAQYSMGDIGRIINPMLDNYKGMALGGGMTIVDGKPYYLIQIAPQFDIGNFGFGFDGNIRISDKGELRKEDFRDWYSAVRWINFIRYGHHRDDIYVRVGGLTNSEIGNGTIISGYSNFSSYDDRKIGAAARLDLNLFGAEGLTSDFFRPGLMAVRPFARPFQLPGFNQIWGLKDIEIGATMVLDFDTNAARIIPNHAPYVLRIPVDSLRDSIVYVQDSARLAVPFVTYGLDIGTYLWRTDETQGRIYADYIKFAQYNDGVIVGMRAAFNASSDLFVDLRGERSFFHNQFIPNYYNSMYELDRYDVQARPQDYITKITRLADTTSGNGNGFRAGALIRLHNIIELRTNYLHLDNLAGRDVMNVEVIFPKLLDHFWISGAYSRENIDGINDLFWLDERSLLTAQASYQLFSWLIASCTARWTFATDENGRMHSQTIIEPKADFIMRF